LDGCKPDTSGAIRYRISTGAYELDGASENWAAWAWSGNAGFHVPAFDCGGEDFGFPPTAACGIYRTPDLDWKAVDEERIR
jgi:hypothetical protein